MTIERSMNGKHEEIETCLLRLKRGQKPEPMDHDLRESPFQDCVSVYPPDIEQWVSNRKIENMEGMK